MDAFATRHDVSHQIPRKDQIRPLAPFVADRQDAEKRALSLIQAQLFARHRATSGSGPAETAVANVANVTSTTSARVAIEPASAAALSRDESENVAPLSPVGQVITVPAAQSPWQYPYCCAVLQRTFEASCDSCRQQAYWGDPVVHTTLIYLHAWRYAGPGRIFVVVVGCLDVDVDLDLVLVLMLVLVAMRVVVCTCTYFHSRRGLSVICCLVFFFSPRLVISSTPTVLGGLRIRLTRSVCGSVAAMQRQCI